MLSTFITQSIAIIAPLALAAAAAMAEPPAIFVDLTVDQAAKKAQQENRLVLVDATAEWCGPCKMMDRTTWVDDKVVEWINANAIAVQFDVDHEEDTAKRFQIRAMPTVIVLKDGKEFDRKVGYMDGPKLIDWLDQVKAGKSSLDVLREKAGNRMDEDGNVDVRERYDMAGEFLNANAYEEALDEYLWLWDNMVEFEPAMGGVRGSFMAGDMERLAASHAPAKQKFTQLRDDLAAKLRSGDGGFEALDDWIVLNEVIGDSDATLAWIDRIKDRPDAHKTFKRTWFRIDNLLVDAKRYELYGTIVPDPVRTARRDLAMLNDRFLPPSMDEDQRRQFTEMQNQRATDEIATLHASLLLANREQEATEVADELFAKLPGCDARIALANKAMDLGVVTKRHLAWLDECPAKQDINELRDRIEKRLMEQKKGGR